MSKVFVVDANRKPLDPVHPGYARLLLTQRKAAVLRRFPFTIILKSVVEQPQVPLTIASGLKAGLPRRWRVGCATC
jgi:hypothetical protein